MEIQLNKLIMKSLTFLVTATEQPMVVDFVYMHPDWVGQHQVKRQVQDALNVYSAELERRQDSLHLFYAFKNSYNSRTLNQLSEDLRPWGSERIVDLLLRLLNHNLIIVQDYCLTNPENFRINLE